MTAVLRCLKWLQVSQSLDFENLTLKHLIVSGQRPGEFVKPPKPYILKDKCIHCLLDQDQAEAALLFLFDLMDNMSICLLF